MMIDGTTLDAAVMVDLVMRLPAIAWVHTKESCTRAADHLEDMLKRVGVETEVERAFVHAAIAVLRSQAKTKEE
jgi:hypothetical protein